VDDNREKTNKYFSNEKTFYKRTFSKAKTMPNGKEQDWDGKHVLTKYKSETE